MPATSMAKKIGDTIAQSIPPIPIPYPKLACEINKLGSVLGGTILFDAKETRIAGRQRTGIQ